MGELCAKCAKGFAWTVLVLGVGFLGVDWGWWSFWGLSWWTVVFLIVAFTKLCKTHCKDCQSCCAAVEEKPKKRR